MQLVVIISPHLKCNLISKSISVVCVNLMLMVTIISIRNINKGCWRNKCRLVIQPRLITVLASNDVVKSNTCNMDLHLGFYGIMIGHFQNLESLLQNTNCSFHVVPSKGVPVVEKLLVVSISSMRIPTPPKFTEMVANSWIWGKKRWCIAISTIHEIKFSRGHLKSSTNGRPENPRI